MKTHLCTDGSSSPDLVKDDEDRRILMNYFAIFSYHHCLRLLAFTIMSNPVHIMLDGDEANMHNFFNDIKRSYGRWYGHKYHESDLMSKLQYKVIPVIDEESEKRTIAYILANIIAVDRATSYYSYRWSSGNCYFNDNVVRPGLKKAKEMTLRERYRILHSRLDVPEEWLVDESGIIVKKSYVAWRPVELLFRTSASLSFFVNRSSKMKGVQATGSSLLTDESVRLIARDLCSSMFATDNFPALDFTAKNRLLRELASRVGQDSKQIARVLNLNEMAVREILSGNQ